MSSRNNEIHYSDGSVEDRIFEILQASPNLGSTEMLIPSGNEEWAVEYHLSPVRSNLLRPFHLKGLDVLEIGSGMGALSRYLAENCSHLTMVEGTNKRLKTAKSRLRDLKNWDSFCGNFQSFSSSRKYDLVCFFGVLEYSEVYIQSPDPFKTVIERAKSFLKEGGAVAVAIENKYGLKYFSGASEDHTGYLFEGIMGYRPKPSPRTFSYHELKSLFASCGLSHQVLYGAFPDYKMPVSLIREDLMDGEPSLSGELASTAPSRDYSGPRVQLFSDTLATRTAGSSGMLKYLANSYLSFFSSSNEGALKIILPHEMGFHYSTGRRHNTVTTFYKDGEALYADKSLLTDYASKSEPTSSVQWQALKKQSIIPGEKLSVHFMRLLLTDDLNDDFWREWLAFFKFITLNYSAPNHQLPGLCWDMIPSNIMFNQGKYIPFDTEWSTPATFDFSWFVLRCCLTFSSDLFLLHNLKEIDTLEKLYSETLRRLNVSANLESDLNNEIEAQKHITGSILSIGTYEECVAFMNRKITEFPTSLRRDRFLHEIIHERLGLSDQLRNARLEIERLMNPQDSSDSL